jgi:hypothetical protein
LDTNEADCKNTDENISEPRSREDLLQKLKLLAITEEDDFDNDINDETDDDNFATDSTDDISCDEKLCE